ncbi:MAG: hypothetical protein ABJN84_04350 [Flavobacteriaceae bacterium]
MNDHTIILTENDKKHKVKISAIGGEVTLKDELDSVAHIREEDPAYRLEIDLQHLLWRVK